MQTPPPLAPALHLVEETNRELSETEARARAARALLAADIRRLASDHLGSVDALAVLVAPVLGVEPRTVRNNLYRRFPADVLAACVETLAAHTTTTRREAA